MSSLTAFCFYTKLYLPKLIRCPNTLNPKFSVKFQIPLFPNPVLNPSGLIVDRLGFASSFPWVGFETLREFLRIC